MGSFGTSRFWQQFDYDFRVKMASAMKRGLVGATKQVKDYAEALAYKEFGNPTDTAAEFGRIAEAMRTALLESYESQVEGRKVVESYRAGQGRLPHALGVALQHPSMVVGDANGIHYLNTVLLDQAARHWRRLNYGAQPAPQNPAAPVPVRFDDRILFYAGSEAQPRAPFQLPVGRFIDPRSGRRVPYGPTDDGLSAYTGSPPTVDRFFPGGGGRQYLRGFTRGIEGRHFIDAGFVVLAEEFGPTLEALVRKWLAQGRGSVKPSHTVVDA